MNLAIAELKTVHRLGRGFLRPTGSSAVRDERLDEIKPGWGGTSAMRCSSVRVIRKMFRECV